MVSRRQRVADALARVYERIPDAGCRGLCVAACSAIDASTAEVTRMRRAGVSLPSPEQMRETARRTGSFTCPALREGRCAVYEVRPVICRLYGATESLRCPYGCAPVGGRLSDEDAHALIAESFAVGGGRQIPEEVLEMLREVLRNPVTREAYRIWLSREPERPVSPWHRRG